METYAYNADARLETATTAIIDDAGATTTLTRGHTYDAYGRLSSTTHPSSVTIAREYNERGYLAKLKHGEAALVSVTARTARGRSKAEVYGNGAKTERSYDALGRPTGIDTTRGAAKIQDSAYAWRSDGSLESRVAGAAGSRSRREERFDYDYLNRLTRARTYISDSAIASRTLACQYDPRGNRKTRTGGAWADDDATGYAHAATSNRLASADIGGVAHRFAHDAGGHITHYDACGGAADCAADDTFIDWNARGLAEKVTVGESAVDAKPTARDSFRYGPDGARYFKKSEWAVESGGTTTMKTSRKYYAGAYEKTATVGGGTVERTRIGDSAVHVRTTSGGMMPTTSSVFEYAHRDHLGSVEAVTDQAGNELVVLGHDPYGERRRNDWTGQLTDTEIESLLNAQGERVSRGFTRHEHLDRTGLVHMNGRMYDPRLGRFLSPDPIIGDPTSSQSWNFYSYVGNNPLSYVDPTGLNRWEGGCGWLCPDDIDAWWDWLNFVYSWWDIPASGPEPYSGSDPYSASDYESTSSKAKKTLGHLDHSVAQEPVDSTGAEKSFLDKIFEVIANDERSIPLEEILGPVLEEATEKTLEEVKARGDVILSDVVVSSGKAIGSFENTGSETSIPLEKGKLILDEKIGGAFEVSAKELVLVNLEGMGGRRWGVTKHL
ncbi:MAG: RHS repeat-associated core domain-containing protein, partial [Acidobacteria bacterium]|nr:RHS repeat-associated core domain-containing protein [Acidobacteriota bacterium]